MHLIDRQELFELTSRLVSIDSTNPRLVPGAAGEHEIARFVADWFKRAGLETHVAPVDGRPNVIGIVRGTGNGRALMLNAHMDTVGAGSMPDPLRPRVVDGQLHGRGALDMKAGLAAIMMVGAQLRLQPLTGDVIVAAVVDEEWGSVGTEALLANHRADAAIVTEPTDLRVCVAHKGASSFTITTQGVAAHGSRPERGIDAIAKMGPILAGIDELARELRTGPRHPLLGTGSIHTGVIHGGEADSVYPEHCRVTIERRRLPGETTSAVEKELLDLLARCHAADAELDASLAQTFSCDPFYADVASPIVVTLQSVLAAAGSDPDPVGMPYWTDAAILAGAGIPSVVFGPAGRGEHAIDEHVDLLSIAACAEALLSTARKFCS